jgi:hypothetical protein
VHRTTEEERAWCKTHLIRYQAIEEAKTIMDILKGRLGQKMGNSKNSRSFVENNNLEEKEKVIKLAFLTGLSSKVNEMIKQKSIIVTCTIITLARLSNIVKRV